MGFIALLYSVGLFWCILHALRYLTTRRNKRMHGGGLPLPSSSQSGRLSSLTTKVVLHHASLKVETSRYNDSYDRMILYLARQTQARLRRVLVLFYDCGSILGLIGMISAVALLVLTVTRSTLSFLDTADNQGIHPLMRASSPTKRSEVSSLVPQHILHASHAGGAPLHLIVPGVTVPLSHLPLLLVALFVTQVVHEVGHAVCSAIESVPLLSIGASLTVLIPSAFVSLSSAAVQSLSPRARARIIAAGAFHNLIYWLCLILAVQTGLGQAFWSIVGYDYIGHFGRVVVATHTDSPLHHSLPNGAVITSLDDLQLTSSGPSVDLWTEYLTHSQHSSSLNDIGWCVDADWFLGQTSDCCSAPHLGSDRACFLEMEPTLSTELTRCAPTLSILHADSEHMKRCTFTADCGDGRLCVKPRDDENLVRIGMWMPGSKDSLTTQDEFADTAVIIWSGPREEILQEVQVDVYLPRYSWLSLGLPGLVATFIDYLATLTLSLYFFNLLPLPFLDGSQLLDTFLDMVFPKGLGFSRNSIAIRDLEPGSGRSNDDRIEPITSGALKKRVARGSAELNPKALVVWWNQYLFADDTIPNGARKRAARR